MRHLEREIEQMKARLRDTVEQYEASTEELKASNEELQAMNEELRSATEELETSREELQSINEELTTVNQELKSKVDELGARQQRPAQPDGRDRHRHRLPRPRAAHHALHAVRRRALQSHPQRPRPSAHRPEAPARLSELTEDAQHVLDTLVPIEREVHDDAGRWFLARLLPYRTTEDRIAGVVLTFIDVSRRKEAEAEQRKLSSQIERQERRFNALIESVSDFIYAFDLSGRFTSANRPLLNLLRRRSDEIIGKSFHQLDYPPDLAARLQREIQQVIETGERVRGITPFTTAEGTREYEYIFAPLFESDGTISGVTGVTRDMTDRNAAQNALRMSEERMRLIVENAREYAIFSTDLHRRITSWNSGAERLLGFSETEILGQTADIIFTAEDRANGACEAEASTAIAHGRATDERWHLRKDRTRFWGSGVMMSMHDAAGQAVGLVKIFRDQSKERAASEALEESRAQLWTALQENEAARAEAEAAGLAKDHFLAVLSHELRTPLTPVLMAVQTLSRRTDLPEPVRSALEMIQRNVEIEAHFIDDMLDLTRLAKGKFEIVREPVDLHEAVRRAVEISTPDIEEKGQHLRLDLTARPHHLTGDSMRLQQVFWNLLKNASKFTPQDGDIELVTRSEDGRIIVEVTDNGIGFEGEAAAKIFDAFEQADEMVAREFGGLGLGLAISKATVDAHGGELTAKSLGRGKGATFTVTLPVET